MHHTMTFDIFCLKLEETYSLVPCRGYTAGRRLKSICLPGSADISRDYLHLLSWNDYVKKADAYTGCAILLFRIPAHVPMPEGNIAALFQPVDENELINHAVSIFAEFEEWHERLHEAAEKHQLPEEMLKSLAKYMEMEIAIAAGKNAFDFITLQKEENDPLGIYDTPPEEMMALLNSQQEFPESFLTHHAAPYPGLYNGLLYYYNFFLEDRYLARLLGIFPDGTFASGKLRLFQYIAEYAEKLYIFHYKNKQRQRKSRQFLFAMENLLQGGEIQPPILQKILDSCSWNTEHFYQVLKIHQENLTKNSDSLDFLCISIEEQFPSCCALRIEENVFCIRNISIEKNPQDFTQILAIFLRENLCRAGISNEHKNIFRLSMLADEAEDALYYGLQNHPMLWSYHFSDYILQYLKAAMTAKYPPIELEHSSINILRVHDQKYNTCLVETLRVFTWQKFSASAAANTMYIHRSTFLHRLRRIQELTNLNFENEQTRQWLALSFFLQPQKSQVENT